MLKKKIRFSKESVFRLGLLAIFVLVCGILLRMKIVGDYKNVNSEIEHSDSYMEIRERIQSSKDKLIIVDAGHGGRDPGKVGVNNALEKDVNLSIAFALKDELINSGFSVYMTRNSDDGLYGELDINKKMADLRKRVNIINDSEAIAVISIHQNAYVDESQKGSQVFYYAKSKVAKDCAKSIQEAIRQNLDKENTREEKANESIYMLKNSTKPMVIVECGFLSNTKEANLLVDKEYQVKLAKTINKGFITWINNILESVY